MIEFDPDWELEWEVGPDVDIRFSAPACPACKDWTCTHEEGCLLEMFGELTPDLPESQPEA